MATTKFNFTKKKLEELPLPSGDTRDVYYDEQVHNLLVRVSSNGSLNFYVRRKVDGVSKRVLIGRYPEISIEQARKKAGDVLYGIANKIPNTTSVRGAKQKELTVFDLFDLYMESYAKDRCTRYGDMRKDFDRYIADWKNMPHTAITRLEVQQRLNRVRQKNGECPYLS